MKMNKKVALGAASLLAMVTLVACGTSPGNKAESESSDKKITVWAMGAEADNLPKVTDKFTEETGIKVDVQSIPWDNAHDKLLTAVASKSGPDVIQMGTTWMAEFEEAGALADITKYVENSDEMAEENFFESNLATTKFDGKTYAVPWVNDVRALYYRTDTLESVGIKKAPETWEEFMTAAKKLTERGEGNYGLSIDANEQSFGFMMGRQAGSELIKDGKALFNQPEFIQGVSYINDFIQKGYAPAQPIATDITQTFGGEEPKTPMFISGPWMVSLLNEAGNNIKGNYATAVLPKGPANNDSVVGGNNLAIASWSNQKDESAEFLEYMSNSETQLEWYKLVNGLPTSKKALEDEAISGDELMKPFVEQLEHAQPMPMVPQYEQIAQSFLAFQQELWVNNADVKEKMNDFQAKAEELLK